MNHHYWHLSVLLLLALARAAHAGWFLGSAAGDDFGNAAKDGDKAGIKLFLKNGGDVNVKNADGTTALMTATMHGHHEIVDLLVGAKADVNVKDEKGMTSLMWASFKGQKQIVRSLFLAKANVNAVDNYGMTALMKASQYNHKAIVRLLLDAKADVNAKDTLHGSSALASSVLKDYKKVIQMLISGGTPPNVYTNPLPDLIYF